MTLDQEVWRMGKRTGIVLKTYMPHKYAVSILEQDKGKATYTLYNAQTVRVGSLIRYTTHNNTLNDIELIDLPLALAKTELLFFHQALELCYYFMPLHMDIPELFGLMQTLYTMPENSMTPLFKKFFLIKLCAYMGVYPQEPEFHDYVQYVREIPLQRMHGMTDNDTMHSAFDDWLQRCVMTHPYNEQFKTITLLYRKPL